MKSCNEKLRMSLHGFKLIKKTKQGAVNDLPNQSDTSQDGVLKSNFTMCDENITYTPTKINAQVIMLIEQNLVGVLWGPWVKEIEVKKR